MREEVVAESPAIVLERLGREFGLPCCEPLARELMEARRLTRGLDRRGSCGCQIPRSTSARTWRSSASARSRVQPSSGLPRLTNRRLPYAPEAESPGASACPRARPLIRLALTRHQAATSFGIPTWSQSIQSSARSSPTFSISKLIHSLQNFRACPLAWSPWPDELAAPLRAAPARRPKHPPAANPQKFVQAVSLVVDVLAFPRRERRVACRNRSACSGGTVNVRVLISAPLSAEGAADMDLDAL